jgi:cytochrome b subunit of formate dehydrogenase
VASNKFVWAPSQGMILGDFEVGDETKNTSNEDVNLEEGNEDSKKDSIPNFVDMSAIWLLVLMLVLVLITLVVVEREKPLKIVPVRVLKLKEILEWEHNFFCA